MSEPRAEASLGARALLLALLAGGTAGAQSFSVNLSAGETTPGSTAPVVVEVRVHDPLPAPDITGWSLVLCYDPAALAFPLAEGAPGTVPGEFHVPGPGAPFTGTMLAAHLWVDVIDTTVGAAHAITLCGSPTVTVGGQVLPASAQPAAVGVLEGGSFLVEPGSAAVEYDPALPELPVLDVPLTILDTAPGPLLGTAGFSFGVAHDPAVATIVDVLQGPFLDAIGPDFDEVGILSTGWTSGVVYYFGGPAHFFGTPEVVKIGRYEPAETAPGGPSPSSPIVVADHLGTPPVPCVIVVNGISHEADRGLGSVTFAPIHFRRGWCNGDASLDIADPIFLLSHLFQGEPLGACPAACDGNGDGVLDIADAVTLIQYVSSGGSAPPPPFAECGGGALGLPCAIGSGCP